MSEFWKSTPKYWCKHCSVYVRDTKLERANHEATGKHQGAIKRSLRDLHRNHEQEERNKERAQREIDRLNGVISHTKTGDGFRKPGADIASGGQASVQDERQRQLEQLAELGVNIPTQLRPELALAGEWQVTSTRVIKDSDGAGDSGRAAGVRKREREQTEEEKEAEDAVQGLFKKPKKWGRGSRTIATEEDAELEQLLSGSLVKPKKEEEAGVVKTEPEPKLEFKMVKGEETVTEHSAAPAVKAEEKDTPPLIKHESTGEVAGLPDIPAFQEVEEAQATQDAVPVVVFKKRKAKNVRQK